MTSVERRMREREGIRRAILDATKELFATEDCEKVSMRRIAEKIDYSPTAIYLHFKSKGELMDALAAEGFALLAAALEAVQADDPTERLRRRGHAYVDFALSNRPAYRIMFVLGDHPQDLYEGHNSHRTWSAHAFDILVSTVREIKELEENAVPASSDAAMLAAGVFWAHLHGVVSLVLTGRGRLFTEMQQQLCRQAVDTAVAGLIALALAPADA